MSFPPICTLFCHISFTKKDSRRRKSPFCLFLIFCHLLPPFAFQRGNQLRSFAIFEREKSFEMSARRNAQATT